MTAPEPRSTLLEQVAVLCDESSGKVEPPWRQRLDTIRRRLDEPLRVAVAGRVKAGKSTLLNSLVGERLAPTDAGECTRIVTWYRAGLTYGVRARLRNGDLRELDFTRGRGSLTIDLGGMSEADILELDIVWPSRRLEKMTLVDTPGLDSLTPRHGARTREFLGLADEGHSQVDCVIYLMRHVHRLDAEFLESFQDRSLARPSPVNAVGVLSRADEIGAARLNALSSAARIAERIGSDDRVRGLCVRVLPVAGLLAETGLTLNQSEGATLRDLAGREPAILDSLLVSVDRFVAPQPGLPSADERKEILARLGLFGVRYALHYIRSGEAPTTNSTAKLLVDASGIRQLTRLIDTHFGRRADLLKARSALANLRDLAREPARRGEPSMQALGAAVDEIEAAARDLDLLRLTHLVLSGTVELPDEHRSTVNHLIEGATATEVLGIEAAADRTAIRAGALAQVEYWRMRAVHPLTDRASGEAFDIIAHAFEDIYAEA